MSLLGTFLASVLIATASSEKLYGISLVANAPTRVALSRVNTVTGTIAVVGPPHSELFGMSDLRVVANGFMFYLGDTPGGATLVGLNATTGAKVCAAVVELKEVQLVGLGQSLDYDSSTDTLLLSGVSRNGTGHTIYRAPADRCGRFQYAGTFGVASYLPMLHSAALDPVGQRLFVTVAPQKQGAAIAIIDLTTGQMSVTPEGVPDADDFLFGIHYDPHGDRLVGVYPNLPKDRVELHTLDLHALRWTVSPIAGAPANWNTMGGNSGVMSAFDVEQRTLYFLAGHQDANGDVAFCLAAVDVDTVTLSTHPRLSTGTVGDSLLALAVAER